MARGRKFRSTRRVPDTERSLFEQKLTGRYTRTLDRTDLLGLIRGGEDTHLEFKIRLVNTDKVVAEIVALANAGGGAIIFGVNDQRRVEGLDNPEQVEEQLIDICRNQIKPPLFPRIDKVSFDTGTRIVVLQVDDRRAPHQTPDHRYYVRIGSTKREAEGAEIAALFALSHANEGYNPREFIFELQCTVHHFVVSLRCDDEIDRGGADEDQRTARQQERPRQLAPQTACTCHACLDGQRLSNHSVTTFSLSAMRTRSAAFLAPNFRITRAR
jgi:hypothetical protein